MKPIAALMLLLSLAASPVQAQRVVVSEKLDVLEARAQRDSNDAAAQYNVAMGYLSQRRYDDAERALRSAVRLESNFADGYLALSVVHDADEGYWKRLKKTSGDSGLRAARDEYLRFYRRAFLTDPLVDIKILGSALKLYGLNTMRYAIEDLVEGQYAKAHDGMSKVIVLRYGNSSLKDVPEHYLWLRGLAAAHAKRYPSAISDIEHLVDRVAGDTISDSSSTYLLRSNEYRYMLAALHHRNGNIDRALLLYRTVLEHDLGVYMAHVQMANILESQRRYGEAIEERRRALNANPEDAILLTDLGVTLGKSGRFVESEQALEQALQINQRDPRPFFWLGLCQAEQGKRDAAKTSLGRFVALAPARWEKQVNLAKQRLAGLQ